MVYDAVADDVDETLINRVHIRPRWADGCWPQIGHRWYMAKIGGYTEEHTHGLSLAVQGLLTIFIGGRDSQSGGWNFNDVYIWTVVKSKFVRLTRHKQEAEQWVTDKTL